MDRDAPPPSSSVVPAYELTTVRTVALAGQGLCGLAALLGLAAAGMGDGTPWPLHTARLVLVFVGAILAGAAVSMRPDQWKVWAAGAIAALLASWGTPEHWDSFRLVFHVLTAAAVAGAVLVSVSVRARLIALSAMILFHFCGIFLATVSPNPSPWLVDQLFGRVFTQYLQFAYLRNAYHFYSPQPGPASLDVFLLKTEVGVDNGVPRYEYLWVVLPVRPKDVRDPLALSYVRRLSLTEQTAAPGGIQFSGASEQNDVILRRRRLAERLPGEPFYPFNPNEAWFNQYRAPRPDVARYVLPSYAQHVLMAQTPDDDAVRMKTSVKVYRLEHETLSVHQFRAGTSPYHPATYQTYFLGEYRFKPDPADPTRTRIELDDPQEKMLYWLVPVIARQPADATQTDYFDFFSAHALSTPWRPVLVEDLDREPYKALAFKWSQLR
ncbi:MAG: hypothetical protein K2P78_04755 [Gemmataceae bacterium]|nr:hypothetical protein [Gemmataceae bacterium]